MRVGAILLLLLFAGNAAAASPPVGRYRLVGEHDVASELELRDDGRFAYALAAGALDERAEGRWTSDGTTVRLTTEPKPRPAVFTAGAARKTAEVPLTLKVTSPDGHGIAGVDLRVGFAAGPPVESYTQEYGWSLGPDEKRTPVWLELSIPMYGLASPRFPIAAAAANDLTFVLTPNDLGIVDFEGLPLTIGSGQLLMRRYGTTLTYVKEEN